MNPELHAFFLDPSASGHFLHAELSQAYRAAYEQAGGQHELMAYADEFDFLLEETREYLDDEAEHHLYPEYVSNLADLQTTLRAMGRRSAQASDLQIEIRQSLEEIEDLRIRYGEGLLAGDNPAYESWLEARQRTLAEVERLRADPDMAPHLDRVVTNLPELANAATPATLAEHASVQATTPSAPADPSPDAETRPAMSADARNALSAALDAAADPALRPYLEPTVQRLREALPELAQTADSERATAQPSNRPLVWAGIGSRGTENEPMPQSVLADMTELARRMAAAGWHLSSGGADGSDTAFANGTPVDQRTIWVPWAGYNDLSGPDCHPIPRNRLQQSLELAERIHPAWDKCSQGMRKLHARNGLILLGRDLDRPVDAVVAYTQGGKLQGGTAQGLRIAMEHNIPIFNLGSMTMEQAWEKLQALQRSLRPDAAVRPAAETGRKEAAGQGASRSYDADTACVFRFSRDEWGIFSNFFPSIQAIDAGGHTFKTSEHLYQAAKFRGSPDVQARIAGAPSAKDAATMGRDTANAPDADWNGRRMNAMRWVIRMKREANTELVDAALRKTGDRSIVEFSRHDAFWGAQPQGNSLVGQNILGRLWMELRQHIRDGDPRALASAWEDPLTPRTVARAPAAHAAEADLPASPGLTTRRQFLQTTGNDWAAAHEDPAAAAATWQSIKTDYASLYAASGDRINHLPYQEGFAGFRDLVAGAVRDGTCPPDHRDRLQALHQTLETQASRHDTVSDAASLLDDAFFRLQDLKEKANSEEGHTIETMPGYTAWLRDRDAAVARWHELAADSAHKELKEHMHIVAPDMMAERIAALSNGPLSSIHEPRADYPVPSSGHDVYTHSLQPLSRIYERALAFVDRDPNLLPYAPQFDELKAALSTALDECSHTPDLVTKLTTLRTTLNENQEHKNRAQALADNVSRASHNLCSLNSWATHAGRPVHEAPRFKAWREEADRALQDYEAAKTNPALAVHLDRADSLGVLTETAVPMLRDDRFREPVAAAASMAASRQRSEEAEEHYSMSA